MPRIILAPTADLAADLAGVADVTIEAEYGSVVIEGRRYTSAHHQSDGPYRGAHLRDGAALAPCIDDSIPVVDQGLILVSHVDADTVLGCARALGAPLVVSWSPDARESFARVCGAPVDAVDRVLLDALADLAAHVDVTGVHRIADWTARPSIPVAHTAPITLRAVAALRAYHAHATATRVRREPDRLYDVTAEVRDHLRTLSLALGGDEQLLLAGEQLDRDELTHDLASWRGFFGDVGIRVSERFANHLYRHDDIVYPVLVCRTLGSGAVTVSLESPIGGLSARSVVQRLWGPSAGGHVGIAGSPRGLPMDGDDHADAVALAHVARQIARGRMLYGQLVVDRVSTDGVSTDEVEIVNRIVIGGLSYDRRIRARVATRDAVAGLITLDLDSVQVQVAGARALAQSPSCWVSGRCS